MASTWSALKIELLETGANAGSWGTLTNANLGDAVLGEAITGSATVDFASDADVTITLTDTATTQAARNLRLNITESSAGVGSVRNLILGSGCQIEKFYLINNTGTGAKTIKNTSGTGISVPAGKATLVYNNGTNVVDAASYFTSLTLGSALPVASGGTGTSSTTFVNLATNVTGTLPIANGGTGTSSTTFANLTTNVTGTLPVANGGTNLTSFTANGVVYASSTSALATGSALSFDGTNLGIGTASPSNTLSLKSETDANIKFEDTTSGVAGYVGPSANNQSDTTATRLGIRGEAGVAFSVGSATKMALDSAGYFSGVWADKVTALGNSGTATTITCTAGNVFTATLTGNCTFTLAAPSTTTANTATSFTLILTNDATPGRTVAFAGGTFKYPGGTVTRTTTAGAIDIWFFFTPDGGTTYYGSIPMANLS